MDILYISAIISFALAACSLIACVVIFFKLNVADAIRFLRHKPTRRNLSKKGSQKSTKAHIVGGSKKSASDNVTDSRRVREDALGKGDDDVDVNGGSVTVSSNFFKNNVTKKSTTVISASDGEYAADGLGDDSERPTDVLGSDAENATDLLVDDGSERATDFLGDDDDRQDADIFVDNAEKATDILAFEESENLTEVLTGDESGDTFDDLFRFRIKQDILVVHTRETIVML